MFGAVAAFWRRLCWWVPAEGRWFVTDPDMQPLRYAFLLILLLIILIFFTLHPVDCLERQVRTIGWLLQVLGFGIVFRGLIQVKNLFGRHAAEMVKRGLARRPHLKPRIFSATVNEILGVSDVTRARGSVALPPGYTNDQRLERLERQVEGLYGVIGNLDDKHERKLAELRKVLEEESRVRIAQHTKIDARLDAAVAGGIYMSMFGVVLFVTGVIAGTASPDIAWLLTGKASCY